MRCRARLRYSANTARFAAPGDAFGVATRVPVRGFAALRSHNAGDATASQRYCIVSRPSIGDLGGNETLQLMHVVNNAISAGNFSEAESASGAYHYRCVYFRNDSDDDVANLKVWLASSDNLAIALESPTAEYVDAVVDETTAPVGPSFTSPTDYARLLCRRCSGDACIGFGRRWKPKTHPSRARRGDSCQCGFIAHGGRRLERCYTGCCWRHRGLPWFGRGERTTLNRHLERRRCRKISSDGPRLLPARRVP